ncbi:MAG TPA: hypothetical protein PK867_08420, partial [Pirellulales bacterium]|nr:hypothetical protein [Pirellulales bacterium]
MIHGGGAQQDGGNLAIRSRRRFGDSARPRLCPSHPLRCLLAVCCTLAAAARLPAEEISFRRDVMPVFFRAGCNSGTCHGAARGKDGFHLSLFGYDPKGDCFRITEEMIGRRVNLASPERSLLLRKSIGAVPHTG